MAIEPNTDTYCLKKRLEKSHLTLNMYLNCEHLCFMKMYVFEIPLFLHHSFCNHISLE